MPKHEKPILDVQAIRVNHDHFRHWDTHFHDNCLLEEYQNPEKDRTTETSDHYLAARGQSLVAPYRVYRLLNGTHWMMSLLQIFSKAIKENTGCVWKRVNNITLEPVH